MAIYRIGYNFRATAGFVTDPADTIGWEAEIYPTSKAMTTSGLNVTAGWDAHIGGHRDRNSGLDARIAGVDSINIGGGAGQLFRVDLPASGAWDVRLAAGDPNFQQRACFDIIDSDGTTVLYAQADTDTVAAEQYIDAQGVLRTTAADWVSNNALRSITFAGTAAYFYLKSPAAGSTVISHLSFYKDTGAGGPIVSTVSSNSANEGTSIVHTVALSGATAGGETFAVSLSGGTATGGGTDYTSTLTNGMLSAGVTVSGGTLTMPAGISSFTISVPTASDVFVEGTETYNLTVGGVTGVGSLLDLVLFTVNSVDLTSFSGFATYTITAGSTSGVDRNINYATVAGTAAPGVDYAATSGTATLLAGNLTVDVLVPILNTRKPDTVLVSTGWTVTGAADAAAALADNSVGSFATGPAITGSQGPLKTQMLPTPLGPGTHTFEVEADWINNAAQVRMSLLSSADVVLGNTGWISLTNTRATYPGSITIASNATRFLLETQ